MEPAAAVGLLRNLLTLGQQASRGQVLPSLNTATQAGSQVAGLMDQPELSGYLGAAGSPISLLNAILTGNPASAVQSGLAGANTVSGLLGGPTAGSIFSGLVDASAGAGGGAAALAGGTGAEAAGAMLPSIMGATMFPGVATGLFGALPMMALGGLLPDWLGMLEPTLKERQQSLYNRGVKGWTGLAPGLMSAADLDPTNVTDLGQALRTAATGARSGDAVDYWNGVLNTGGGSASGIDPTNMLPFAEGEFPREANAWKNYLTLQDQAAGQGIDTRDIQGGDAWERFQKNIKDQYYGQLPTGPLTEDNYNAALTDAFYGGGDLNTGHGKDQYGATTLYNAMGPLANGRTLEDIRQTLADRQKGIDLNDAALDMGRVLGLNTDTIQGTPIDATTVQPGQYTQTIADYLKGIDPNVTSNPQWQQWGLA